MKKLLFAIGIVLVFYSCTETESVRKIKVDELPQPLCEFFDRYYGSPERIYLLERIEMAVEVSKGRKAYYILQLSYGDMIVTDKSGDWIYIDATSKKYRGFDIPDPIIPTQILEYIALNHPTDIKCILKTSKGGYMVQITPGVLYFDNNFKAELVPDEKFGYGEYEKLFMEELGFDATELFIQARGY